MGMEKRVCLILLEEFLVPLLVPDDQSTVDVPRRRSLPEILTVPSATGENTFFICHGRLHFINIEPSSVDL